MRSARITLLVVGLCGVAPVFAESRRYAGLWEGHIMAGRGHRAVALQVRPRGSSGFAGVVYFDGVELAPVDSARIAGDSLTFSVAGYDFQAIGDGDRLTGNLVVRHGAAHAFEMRHTSADTMRAPAADSTAARPPAPAREPPPDSVYRAHALPPASTSSTAPCLRKGTLFLVGGGPTQSDLNRRFVELAGGSSARIVVIPTASIATNDPSEVARLHSAMEGGLGVDNVVVLHTTSRREADSEAFVAPLRQATGVWILGGEASWLLDSYLGTRTERELIALLDRGGVVGGTSAGALIWGSSLMSFRGTSQKRMIEAATAENLIADDHHPGIGLLRNVCIQPHFAEYHMDPPMRRLIDARPGLLGIGIDESTALEVRGDTGRVLGRGTVAIYSAHGDRPPVVLKAGEAYDVVARVKRNAR